MGTPVIPFDPSRRIATAVIRERIERGGERLWRFSDFDNLPFTAVAQTLSRFTRRGTLRRVGKGIYYHGPEATLGKRPPNQATIKKLLAENKPVSSAGLPAANLLGFTKPYASQNSPQGEIAPPAPSSPSKLVADPSVTHARWPQSWRSLSPTDTAFLDILRRRGAPSELSTPQTILRILELASEDGRFERLLKVAHHEPPRVRAMLGAIGQQLGKNPMSLKKLRATLHPVSTYDFGRLKGLEHALAWQAKKRLYPKPA